MKCAWFVFAGSDFDLWVARKARRMIGWQGAGATIIDAYCDLSNSTQVVIILDTDEDDIFEQRKREELIDATVATIPDDMEVRCWVHRGHITTRKTLAEKGWERKWFSYAFGEYPLPDELSRMGPYSYAEQTNQWEPYLIRGIPESGSKVKARPAGECVASEAVTHLFTNPEDDTAINAAFEALNSAWSLYENAWLKPKQPRKVAINVKTADALANAIHRLQNVVLPVVCDVETLDPNGQSLDQKTVDAVFQDYFGRGEEPYARRIVGEFETELEELKKWVGNYADDADPLDKEIKHVVSEACRKCASPDRTLLHEQLAKIASAGEQIVRKLRNKLDTLNDVAGDER